MGTRGLLGFIIASRRHALYKHCDAYPDGLGRDVVGFILGLQPEDYAEMDARLRKVSWNTDWPTNALSEVWDFVRNVQMGVESLEVNDWADFGEDDRLLADSEWAYFIDFENQKLEVWTFDRIVTVLTFDEIIAEGVAVVDAFNFVTWTPSGVY